ncbi:hypothetical protein MDA_GLEAN10006835 [Myotis davidii]|uniref:Mitochondrial nucleoid factor 1 n=1 Tax=Myotis davidii TaxID=225400 RepID=L5LIS4_MYODS|nr:hypothetical protein MDA_GLEAN10006835 [Myotis davidii]
MPTLARPHLGLQVALLFRLPGLWSHSSGPLRAVRQSQASPGWQAPGCAAELTLSPFSPLPCDQYPRPRDTSFSGLTLEEYKLILATDTLGELKDMNKGLWKKLQEKFSARSPEEKQKAWAQSLSRPRT